MSNHIEEHYSNDHTAAELSKFGSEPLKVFTEILNPEKFFPAVFEIGGIFYTFIDSATKPSGTKKSSHSAESHHH